MEGGGEGDEARVKREKMKNGNREKGGKEEK